MFTELATGTDLRPALLEVIQNWIALQVRAVVTSPNAVTVNRIRDNNLDMEIVIEVAPEDRQHITESFCLRLASRVGNDMKAVPIIYLEDAPHPAAREALHYAQCQA